MPGGVYYLKSRQRPEGPDVSFSKRNWGGGDRANRARDFC